MTTVALENIGYVKGYATSITGLPFSYPFIDSSLGIAIKRSITNV